MTATGQQKKKEITALVRRSANYVFHLAAVARVGFDSEYADLYADSVRPDDIAFLQQHKSLLTFGMGSGSDLVPILLFYPAYFDLDFRDDLRNYFSLILQCCDTGDSGPFFDAYAEYFNKLSTWFPISEYEKHLSSISGHRQTIARLGDIVVGNHNNYCERVWPREKAKLDTVAERINEHFRDRNVIAMWEALTGETFKFDYYDILLCSAIKNGPNANSLGYDCVVFHHDRPFDYTTEFICHEVGTHILIGAFKDIAASGRVEWKVLYDAYECLAKFYNRIILDKSELAYELTHFHDREYLEIYGSIRAQNPKVSPRELLTLGIESFQQRLPSQA